MNRFLLRLAALAALAFMYSASKAQASYTYIYWNAESTVARFDPSFGTPAELEVDYGSGYVGSGNYLTSMFQIGDAGPVLSGDDMEYPTVGGIDYAYDTARHYWYVDSGYVSAASAEGYAPCNSPYLTYYGWDWAYDSINDQWYDETVIDPLTGTWQQWSYGPGEPEIIGGVNWEYHTVNSIYYGYDAVLDQWYVVDGYDELGQFDIWIECENPNE